MLILLDIDGVMLNASPWKAPEILGDGFSMFKKQAVDALNEIIRSTNSTILLTTSHKSRFSIPEWKILFKTRGVEVDNIGTIGENVNNLNRLEEIIQWHQNTSSKEDFIIIDDDKRLHALPSYLKEKLISTSPYVGLTKEFVSEAIQKLNQSHLVEEFA